MERLGVLVEDGTHLGSTAGLLCRHLRQADITVGFNEVGLCVGDRVSWYISD